MRIYLSLSQVPKLEKLSRKQGDFCGGIAFTRCHVTAAAFSFVRGVFLPINVFSVLLAAFLWNGTETELVTTG